MRDANALKARIREAFGSVEAPPAGCLSNSREGDEPALLEAEFRGKTDWRILDAAFLDQAPDGFGTALSFFSDEAFHFYLPAYLIADLDRALQQANPVFALTHGLDARSRDEQINRRRYGERTWLDHARCKFAMFNAAERGAIAAYLAYWLEDDDITAFEKQSIREAPESYWNR
jgi:hypothetical protein